MAKTKIVVSLIIVSSIGVLAQSKDSSNLAITRSGSDSIVSSVQFDTAMQENNQMIGKRYMEYNQWFNENVYPLAQEAEKNGIHATQEEIAAQAKAFNAVFPGMPNNSINISKEIMARKYAKSLDGAFVPPGNIQYAYTQLQSEFLNKPLPPLADVQPILEMRALLLNRSVQTELEKCNKQVQKQFNDLNIRASETWPISDLLIHAPDSQCLAQYKDNDSCLLTVKQFNSHIRYVEVNKFISIDAAQTYAIREILKNSYMADEARNKPAVGTDTLAGEKRKWIEDTKERMRYKGIGLPVLDQMSLQDAFSVYYDALFGERRFPYYSIIGSSDSLYMDSIFQALQRDTVKNSRKDNNESKDMNQASGFPWSYSRAVLLPEDFDKYTDSLLINETSKIIRMPYGFFIVRLDSVRIRPALQFEEAKDDCILLATKRKWKNLDSLLEARAYRLYASNKRLNQTPDTLSVIAFLTPANNQTPVSTGGKSPVRGRNNKTPKAGERGLAVVSTQLPADVRDFLISRFGASKDKKKTVGLIPSRYGVWNFKVLDVSRGGCSMMPFSLSKKRLVDSLAAHELESASDILWQKPDSVLDNIALGQCYAPFFFGLFDERREVANNPPEKNSPEDTVERTKEGIPLTRQQKKLQKRAAELEEWLSKISIRLPAVSRR